MIFDDSVGFRNIPWNIGVRRLRRKCSPCFMVLEDCFRGVFIRLRRRIFRIKFG